MDLLDKFDAIVIENDSRISPLDQEYSETQQKAYDSARLMLYHVNGYTLDTKNCAKELILEFGLERLAYVLANTLRYKRYDGRISPENLQWAYTVSVVFEMQKNMNRTVNSRFVVDKCNLGLTDLLVTQVRKLQTLKNSAAKKQ